MIQKYTYRCQEIIAYTKDISLFSLVPSDINHLHHLCGQYVDVILTSGDIFPLSIANTPSQDGHLEFHIRHDKNHVLAQQFINEMPLESEVQLLGPKGNCTLSRAKQAKKIIFLAGGTGFAPINALLEEAIARKAGEIYLYWGVRRPQDVYKASLLQKWQQANPQFHYTIVLSEPDLHPHWQGAVGLVHKVVAKAHPLLQEDCVFASGPFPMIKQARLLFSDQGLLPHHFICDMQEF